MSFARNLSNRYRKQLLDTVTKTGLDAPKTASKKVVDKAAETTDEFIGNRSASKIEKPKPVSDKISRNFEKIIIPPEKQRRNIKPIKAGIIKMKQHETSKLLNHSTVS